MKELGISTYDVESEFMVKHVVAFRPLWLVLGNYCGFGQILLWFW